MSAVADKLREARALIERGWCKKDFGCGDKVCATGAIHTVVTGSPHICGRGCEGIEKALAQAALTEPWNVAGGALVSWNDAPERTQAEVLAAFDKAIELAEQSL